MFYLGQTHKIWEWTSRDSNEATPMHYACCAGNIDMIDILEKEGVRFDVRSLNGSTPLHSAAICGQIKVLTDLISRYPTSVFDSQNMSISHYLAMSARFRNETTEEIIITDKYIPMSLQNKLKEEALFVDDHNRLPLHYVSKNGNVNLFIFYHSIIRDFSVVTRSMDTDGFTILDYAFLNTPIFYKDNVNRVLHCNIYLSSPAVDCNAHRLKIFIPHEYLIYLILKVSDKSRVIVQHNIEKYVNISLQKNNPHLLGLFYYNFPFKYRQYMLKNGIVSLESLFKHPMINPEIFLFLPEMNYDCSDITSKSVLHDIIEDKKRTFWSSQFFDFSKFKILSKSLDLCVDDNGRNFLHRSVIGGNYLAFHFLRKEGKSFYTKTRDGRNLLQLLVDSAPCFEEKPKRRKLVLFIYDKNGEVEKSWIENIFISDSYNAIASFLVNETRLLDDMSLHEICNPASESLSFSHKVAAKGILAVLLEIEKQFGSNASSCANKNNITSGTLFNFFNHFDKLPMSFGKSNINHDLIAPLFLKILMDFKPFLFPKYSVVRKCNYRMKNYRNIRSMEICIFRLEKEYLRLLQQFFKISGIKSNEDFGRSFRGDNGCFAKYLSALKSINEIPKSSLEPTCLTKDWILKKLQTECSKTSRSSKKIKRTLCYEIISILVKKGKYIEYSYSRVKVKYFFLLVSLYQSKINIPYESVGRFITKSTGVEFVDLSFESAYLRSAVKPDFHMHKKYKFWDWFKSCKNCLAKIMMNRISSLSAWDIRKWKGSMNSIPMKIFCNLSTILEDVNTPLKKYDSRFGDADVT